MIPQQRPPGALTAALVAERFPTYRATLHEAVRKPGEIRRPGSDPAALVDDDRARDERRQILVDALPVHRTAIAPGRPGRRRPGARRTAPDPRRRPACAPHRHRARPEGMTMQPTPLPTRAMNAVEAAQINAARDRYWGLLGTHDAAVEQIRIALDLPYGHPAPRMLLDRETSVAAGDHVPRAAAGDPGEVTADLSHRTADQA